MRYYNFNKNVMAKISKQDREEINAQKKELAKYIMNKIGMKYNEFIEAAEALLINEYSGILTTEEKQKFNKIIFAN